MTLVGDRHRAPTGRRPRRSAGRPLRARARRAHLPDLGADLRLQPGLRALPVELGPARPRRAHHRRVQGADRRVRAHADLLREHRRRRAHRAARLLGAGRLRHRPPRRASSSRPTARGSPPAVAGRLAGQRLRRRADLPRRGHRRRQRRRPRRRAPSPPRSRRHGPAGRGRLRRLQAVGGGHPAQRRPARRLQGAGRPLRGPAPAHPAAARRAGGPTSGTSCTRPPTSSGASTTGWWPTARTCSPATPSSTWPATARPCPGSTCAARDGWSAWSTRSATSTPARSPSTTSSWPATCARPAGSPGSGATPSSSPTCGGRRARGRADPAGTTTPAGAGAWRPSSSPACRSTDPTPSACSATASAPWPPAGRPTTAPCRRPTTRGRPRRSPVALRSARRPDRACDESPLAAARARPTLPLSHGRPRRTLRAGRTHGARRGWSSAPTRPTSGVAARLSDRHVGLLPGPGGRRVPAWWSPRRRRSTRRTGPTSGPRWPSRCGPGWPAVAEACRPHGTLVLAGLGHCGSAGVERLLAVGALGARRRWPTWSAARCRWRWSQPDIDALVDGLRRRRPAGRRRRASTGSRSTPAPTSLLRQFHSGPHQPAGRRATAPTACASPREVLARRPDRPRARTACSPCGCAATSWPRGPGSPPSRRPHQVDALADLVDLIVVVRGGPFSRRPTVPTPTPRPASTSSCAGRCARRPADGPPSSCRAAWSTRRWPSGPRRRGGRPGRDDPGPDRRAPPGRPGPRRRRPTGCGPASSATRPARSGTTATRWSAAWASPAAATRRSSRPGRRAPTAVERRGAGGGRRAWPASSAPGCWPARGPPGAGGRAVGPARRGAARPRRSARAASGWPRWPTG